MVGNGMRGTLLGIRGNIGDFHLAYVGGHGGLFRRLPAGVARGAGHDQKVGHVRVFAALGSLISSLLILYAVAPHWIAWARCGS